MDVVFSWQYAGFPPEKAKEKAREALLYLKRLANLRQKPDWSAPEASILLADEKKFAQASIRAAKGCSKAALFILVGIGGSNLGTMAIRDFIMGRNANLLTGKHMLFADTCDPSSLDEIIRIMKLHLAKKKQVVLNIVSKSGTTTETLANFEAIYATLSPSEKKLVKVYATTDAGSQLHSIASKKGWPTLPIPPAVGGRFSVLSCVGLFPLAWAGVDVNKLLAGASKMLSVCLKDNVNENPALAQAALMSLHIESGKNIIDTFCFCNDLHSYGMWYRQLLAESAGKGPASPTPMVSIGSTDLHSQEQLYLGGSRDKIFRIVSLAGFADDQLVPNTPALSLASGLGGKSTSEIFLALEGGTKSSFRNSYIPFWEILLPAKNEEAFGALLQLDMVSVMLFCKFLKVNAFDQPAVEEYKKEAKKLLS